MSVETSDIEKIATLARIRIEESEIPEVVSRLNDILHMVDKMQSVDTSAVEPMANPLDAVQRLRSDQTGEIDRRERFQAIAPSVDEGFYLVPKVIE
jgi:aspartyl-tRNA(Asn)/glutamyl-tRNA(Gln) amidotransferase subunit C